VYCGMCVRCEINLSSEVDILVLNFSAVRSTCVYEICVPRVRYTARLRAYCVQKVQKATSDKDLNLFIHSTSINLQTTIFSLK